MDGKLVFQVKNFKRISRCFRPAYSSFRRVCRLPHIFESFWMVYFHDWKTRLSGGSFNGIGKFKSCIFGCDPNMQVNGRSTTHINQPTFIPLKCACVIKCVTKICKFFILQIVFFRQGSSIHCYAKIVPSYWSKFFDPPTLTFGEKCYRYSPKTLYITV